MATQARSNLLNLDALLVRELDDLVATGRFTSREDAIRHAVKLVWDAEYAPKPLGQEERAGVERGLADAQAGRVRPVDEVFEELLSELRTKL